MLERDGHWGKLLGWDYQGKREKKTRGEEKEKEKEKKQEEEEEEEQEEAAKGNTVGRRDEDYLG